MPTFNGYDNNCLSQALQFITGLISKGKVFKIEDLSGMTKSQRGLLHVYCGIVAKELGLTIQYVKENYYKGIVNPDVFAVAVHDPVTDEWKVTYKSSEGLPREVISSTIERFRHWALAELNISLPDPEDKLAINRAFIEVNNYNRQYGYGR